MRKALLGFSIVATAAAGIGGLIGAAGPWSWLALAAAIVIAVSFLLPTSTTADSESAPAPAVLNRPSASRSVTPRSEDGSELQSLRSELAKQKQLERDLLSAKQAAEAAMMSKGEFLATMSHEIRTPLNGIIPLLDILRGTPLQDDQREYVLTAYQSARELLRIVDDILDYSKLDANKLTLETVGLNLRELLDAVIRLMEKPAEAKSLKLSLSIDPAVRLAARGDPVRLRQVLTNLISNAIKFTDRGHVDLKLTRLGETHDTHQLRFEVHDTGIGLDADAQTRLFQPFTQADASTTRTFGGTGLGLVICKRIIDLMGGKIGVKSSLGRGSMFWFEIPLLKAIGDISASRKELDGARCLVLTSNPVLQRRLMGTLPGWDVVPVLTSTTQEALAKLRDAAGRGHSWAFDLLIADLGSIRSTAIALQRAVLGEAALSALKVLWLEGGSGQPVPLEHGPRMHFVNREPGDTELRLELKALIETSEPSVAESESAPPPPIAAPISISHEKLSGHVLLVEDNAVNRQVAQRLLMLCGLSMDVAENGKEALERLRSGQYLAVLMDCQMPVMDGYAATRGRRDDERQHGLTRIPIIAMTANAMLGDREKCLQAGMDDYLSKPLNRALLEETLRKWIAPSAAPHQALVEVPAEAMAEVATSDKRPHLAAVPRATTVATAPLNGLPAMADVAAFADQIPVGEVVPTDHGEPALNADIVSDLRDIMGSEFNALVAVFLEDSPRAIMQLQSAANEGDEHTLIGPAHSLKSTSANLGALRMSELAKTIEHGARQSKLDDPARLVSQLAAEFNRVEAALRQTVQSVH